MLLATLKNIWRTLCGKYWRVVPCPYPWDGWCIEFKRTGARQFERLGMNRAEALRAAKTFNTPLP